MQHVAWRSWLLGIVFGLILAWPVSGFARQVPMVTGENWVHSTPQEREAFVLGATTIMELEQEVQGTPPPPPKKSLIDVWCRGLSHFTIDGIVKTIDAWYAAHPDKLARPVVAVMWYELAKPNADKP